MTVLGGGIDELDVEGLKVRSLGNSDDRLSEGDGPLSGSGDASLDKKPVLVDLTVVRETAHGGDALLGKISLGGCRVGIVLLSDTENTLVDLGTVMVTLLSSSGHTNGDSGRMPRSDTRHLT